MELGEETMKNIMLIGGCYHDKVNIQEKDKVQQAANNLFTNIIKGMPEDENLIVINDVRRRCFQRGKKIVCRNNIYDDGKVKYIDYAYINIPILSRFFKLISIMLEVKRYSKYCDRVIVYCMYTPYLFPINY